jgi:hypothetical protein
MNVPPALIDTVPLIKTAQLKAAFVVDIFVFKFDAVIETDPYADPILAPDVLEVIATPEQEYKILLSVAVPANPRPNVFAVVPADLLNTKPSSNSYTVLADSVTPTPNMLCAPVAFAPTTADSSL